MFTAKSEMDLRLQVKDKFFSQYKVSLEDKRIDFLVYSPTSLFTSETFLWAESKKDITPVETMFTQLLLTIKKTVDDGEMPPMFLCVFDKEKIAFIEYHHILPVFNLNDFNWNEKPSTVSKKTENTVAKFLTKESLCRFEFKKDEAELREFIKTNFIVGNVSLYKAQINKNNFVTIYNKWIETVRPSINLRFEEFKKYDILDGDFFLADLLSKNNKSLYKKLKIFLRETHYSINIDKIEHLIKEVHFNDQGQAHKQFWEKYKRPPAEEYWQYMLERRDLLVPQKIRERKGSFFTPKIWVEKSQEYLEKAFGENWQDEYYIWDCCCGTGNLLVGLVNPDNIWASTLDQPDVDIVHTNIDEGFNLLKPHVFQFDFLNDEFIPQSKGGKVPDQLFKIISDPEKQKKLIIYINPPYGECGRSEGKGYENKSGIASTNETYLKFTITLGKALREMASLFMARIYSEFPNSNLAVFSKLKYVNAPNFARFRKWFKAEYKNGFIVPANTFDNVSGHFPIAFLIWKLQEKKKITSIKYDVFDRRNVFITKGKTVTNDNRKLINAWIDTVRCEGDTIGHLSCKLNDFQNNKMVYIAPFPTDLPVGCKVLNITKDNLIEASIYLTVRHLFEHTWINDRDQFLYPNDGYKRNKKFQNDCLIFTLFHHQNRITSKDGVNHWIPFTRKDVKGKDSFASTFMSDFLQTRGIVSGGACPALSKAATAVFEVGKSLWKYYHETIKSGDNASVNASLYEIREYFKGRNNAGRMNTKATDEKFTELDKALKDSLKTLAKKIQPKVYEYGFLLE